MGHKSLIALCQKLGHRFQNMAFLETALTHRSYGANHNERLEFLGDALLNFFIAEKLFSNHPEMNEGELSRLRASLVNGEILAVLAKELTIDQYLRLGQGEIKSGGVYRRSILSNSIEAVIGAIYLDANIETCKKCVVFWFGDKIHTIVSKGATKDPKTFLQEYLQRKKMKLPKYVVLSVTGKGHEQIFRIECRVTDFRETTTGEGSSRRKAEQLAAENFLTLVNETYEK